MGVECLVVLALAVAEIVFDEDQLTVVGPAPRSPTSVAYDATGGGNHDFVSASPNLGADKINRVAVMGVVPASVVGRCDPHPDPTGKGHRQANRRTWTRRCALGRRDLAWGLKTKQSPNHH